MGKQGLEAFRSKRELVRRLVMAELLARPGEGPLAPLVRPRVPNRPPEREAPIDAPPEKP